MFAFTCMCVGRYVGCMVDNPEPVAPPPKSWVGIRPSYIDNSDGADADAAVICNVLYTLCSVQ